MSLIDKQTLAARLSPPFDAFLTAQLLDEFISLERRFVLQDWEPAELDGGQFSEILARMLYHQDSGNLNLSKPFADCRSYVENDQVRHNVLPRDDAKCIFDVLGLVYRFRSRRGAVHVSPTYKANHMDARFMIEAVRWAMTETLRVFWTGDRESAAKAIREVLRFDVPAVAKIEDSILVQRTDVTAEEEVLILLHDAGERGYTRKEIEKHARCSARSVTRALDALTSPSCRQVLELGVGRFVLTDLGEKRIREDLASKLVLA